MSQPDDVDKMLSDFLVELQVLSDSLQTSGEKAAPDSGTQQTDDMLGEVLPVAAQHSAATQPGPLAEGETATDPALSVRSALFTDTAGPPLEAKKEEFPHSCRALYDSRSSSAQAVRKWRRALLWACVSLVAVCVLGALYSFDPFGWKQLLPAAPPGASMPDPSSARPALPIDKVVPALSTPPTPPSSPGPQPATAAKAPPRLTPPPLTAHSIGVSYVTVMAQLDKVFAMKRVGPIEGQERYVGQTDDKMAKLEIIGNKEHVSEACLTAALPTDHPRAAERNAAFAFVFVNNIEPQWADAPNWIAENLVNMSKSDTESVGITRGERLFALRWMKKTGTMSISVRHKGQKEPTTEQSPPK